MFEKGGINMKRSRLSKGVVSKPKVRLRHWLEGRTIVGVRKMTSEEAERVGWDVDMLKQKVAPVIVLDDGTAILPSSDEEGNDIGMLFASRKKKILYVFPKEKG
jgi:hypothetical protein